jgi:hypothetical protein
VFRTSHEKDTIIDQQLGHEPSSKSGEEKWKRFGVLPRDDKESVQLIVGPLEGQGATVVGR